MVIWGVWNGQRSGVFRPALAGALLLGLTVPVQADIYRWVDDNGTVHYSSTPQPETSQRERRIYDSEGRMREILPAPMSAEERAQAAAEREQAERNLEATQRARQDRVAREHQLRRAYTSLEEIEELRERRERSIGGNVLRSEAQEKTLLRERERIRRQLDGVNENSALADRYRAELDELDARIARERQYRRGQRERLSAIHERLDLDRRDFQQLVLNGRVND
ncbi:DUF4124 domain-containing protein [Thioalkalivibrio sp. ALMg13-2]|uniref:DUF4124 domain-containing protein n=1 Tax=Thioalkalivibrio sp. ALMg13-2 TaxID=1158167 RepID=UPI00037BAD47|nr:DUF4124 domain-containing protein [Thioalkalivibrio sp. ALMg13-2]